jgi:hypothetical protein
MRKNKRWRETLFAYQKGEQLMLDHTIACFSVPSTCGHDPGVQRLVASMRPVSFRQVGCVPCIEVVGIPALKCQVCTSQTYDLSLLARLESVLWKRVEQGVLQARYTYEQLASELTTDIQSS